MSGPKHTPTPGPWRAYFPDEASHEPVWIGTTEGAPIADVRDPDAAKLIAAAPRLAEVLRSAPEPRDALSNDEDVELLRREYEKWHDAARAALREAGVS